MTTPSGIMTGTYRMVNEKGDVFDAGDSRIFARFSLCAARS